MKKGLIIAGIMVAVFLMPAGVSAKKPAFLGWQKHGRKFEHQGKSWRHKNWHRGWDRSHHNKNNNLDSWLSMPNSDNNCHQCGNHKPKPKPRPRPNCDTPGVCKNSGAIWTVNNPDVEQDVNHYKPGDKVYLNGKNLPCDSVDYAIWTNPPNSQNGTKVTSGTIQLTGGKINDVLIWTIPADIAGGVYKVQITTCCGVKHDNFSVRKVKEVCDGCNRGCWKHHKHHCWVKPPCCGICGGEDEDGGDEDGNGQQNGDEQNGNDQNGNEEKVENGEVAGAKDEAMGGGLPASGPSMGILVLISLVAMIASSKIRKEVLAELKK